MDKVWIVLAIMSFVYGWFMMSLKSGSHFYAVWFAGVLFFLLIAADRYFHFWKKLPALFRRIVGVGFWGGVLLLAVIEVMILGSFSAKPEETVDYLVVLGAQVRENGPGRVLRYRLDVAAEYLVDHPETRCIVSGGQGPNEPWSEAKGMRDYLVGKGIEESRIIMEEKSTSTVQNIAFSTEFITPRRDSLCIVTSDFHMFRALSLAKKQGIRNIQGLSAPSHGLYLPQNMFREFFGVVKDFLCGNLSVG